MKKSIFFSILLIITIHISGQTEKSLLWEISGNGISKPSYIFGTMHLMCPGDFNLNDATKQAFDKTDQLYLELDFDDPGMMIELQKKMMLPEGKTLKQYLTDEEYQLLNDFFTSTLKTGMAMLERMKPMVLSSMIDMALLSCNLQSYELTLAKMAGDNKKEILGLETAAYQMAIFDTIPYEKQVAQIVDMVKRKDVAIREFTDMVKLYKDQDLDGLLNMMDTSEWNFKEYNDIFINNRNANWIPIISKAVAEKSTFIAVGAGHLGGKKGVLQLLKNAGYTVKPVKNRI